MEPLSISENFALNDIDLVNDTLGFTIGNSGRILKTEDAGETDGVSMVNAQTGYISGYSGASNSGVLKTTNGGTVGRFLPRKELSGFLSLRRIPGTLDGPILGKPLSTKPPMGQQTGIIIWLIQVPYSNRFSLLP